MYHSARPQLSQRRRGVILVVVLLLLTLFALVGLGFVLYAESEATSARVFREAQDQARADVDPELLLAYFLGQFLYDVKDDEPGVYSALRGHSLLRSLYGFNDGAANDVPFNGTGRLHHPGPFAGRTDVPAEAKDDYYLVNYTWFRDDSQLPPARRFLRDPERPGQRAGLSAARRPFAGGFDAPYTYPDLNNLYLAAVRADGTVLLPSFHRPWLFGPNDATNPNWTSVAGKYLTLRPRPIDMGPGFPYPEDEGGDVKNLPANKGGNDSYWLDLGAPVMVAPDGRKFKPLFAPLVVDLDGRVNVNVHGNARGRDHAHVSNLGLGPWEVNPRRLAAGAGPRLEREWADLLLGTATPPRPGRYGSGPSRRLSFGPTPFYSRLDFDGCDDGVGGVPTAPMRLPGFGGPPTGPFPSYPPGYGSDREGDDHPLLHTAFPPSPGARGFAASNLEALLRHGDTGSEALSSELLRFCPENLGGATEGAARRRRLVTTHSFDLDRPGVTAWAWDSRGHPYTLNRTDPHPRGDSILLPRRGLPRDGEFGSDGRATSAALGRVDLNRPLPPYPAADPRTGRITDQAAFLAAQQARQELARDLYVRLVRVTGAYDPFQGDPRATPPTPGEVDALRWLAQLAVNCVDYVDADDFLTPFQWGAVGGPAFAAAHGGEWVYGTELPRLVVNEAYVEYANDPADPGLAATPPRVTKPLRVHFWVELHNPLSADPVLSDGGAARLQAAATDAEPAYAAYRLVVARSPNPGLRQPDNVGGDPDPDNTLLVVSDYTSEAQPGPDAHLVKPAGGRFAGTPGGNDGFCVLGPPADFPGTSPDRPRATLRLKGLTYEVPPAALASPLPQHALLLQRLACPQLPPNPATPGGVVDPGRPLNPYVTIDYVQGVPANDAVVADARGPHRPTPVTSRASHGRNQPYAAHASQLRRQQPQPARAGQPQHTFFRHNARADADPPRPGPGQMLRVPFDWPVHLDRPLVSPVELLHVSAFKPHEWTQQFSTFAGPFQHSAPWLDPEARLYRFFEFLTTHAPTAGTPPPPGGRVAGKINVNTIWDPEVLLALCDPQPSNNFTAADVYKPLGRGPGFDDVNDPQSIYWRLMLSRTPGLLQGGGPGPDDRPFWGLAAGPVAPDSRPYAQHPRGQGVEDTLFRSFEGTGPRRLFQPPLPPPGDPNRHPFLQYQLLTKIFNHLTTRSNVFAVWLTVGFFEVTDATTRPVKLGAELGRAEDRQVRHRLFAVVDRSRLPRHPGPVPAYDPRRDPFGPVLHLSVIN